MPWNPRRYDRSDALGHREVFGAEGCNWHRVEEWTEENEFVEFWFRSPFAAKKKRNKSDGKTTAATPYDHVTWMGIASRAMANGETIKLCPTDSPFCLDRAWSRVGLRLPG